MNKKWVSIGLLIGIFLIWFLFIPLPTQYLSEVEITDVDVCNIDSNCVAFGTPYSEGSCINKEINDKYIERGICSSAMADFTHGNYSEEKSGYIYLGGMEYHYNVTCFCEKQNWDREFFNATGLCRSKVEECTLSPIDCLRTETRKAIGLS